MSTKTTTETTFDEVTDTLGGLDAESPIFNREHPAALDPASINPGLVHRVNRAWDQLVRITRDLNSTTEAIKSQITRHVDLGNLTDLHNGSSGSTVLSSTAARLIEAEATYRLLLTEAAFQARKVTE